MIQEAETFLNSYNDDLAWSSSLYYDDELDWDQQSDEFYDDVGW